MKTLGKQLQIKVIKQCTLTMIFTAKGKLDNKTQLPTCLDTYSWAERSQGVKDSWQEFMFHAGIQEVS